MKRPDVLIVTALLDELDAVLALGEGGVAGWQPKDDRKGFPYHVRELPNEKGESLVVAAAWAGDMGELAAATRAAELIDELQPNCVAMCGICAGRRGDVSLGDVIMADRVYSYDHGKQIAITGAPAKLSRDITTYNLAAEWKVKATYFARAFAAKTEALQKTRPPTLISQRQWLLRTLFDEKGNTGHAPSRHPDRSAHCPRWADAVEALEQQKLVSIDVEGALALTDAGREWVLKDRAKHPDGAPAEPPFCVHVGPIATGKAVREDPDLFKQLAESVRKTLGVEMEAVAIGFLAERLGHRWVVAKAVSDHGDHEKDDSFRAFACRASAEVLFAFLKQNLAPRPQPVDAYSTSERPPPTLAPSTSKEAPAFAPLTSERAKALELRAPHDREVDAHDRPRSEFVARVERVCRLREGETANVVELRAPPPLAGLLEVTRPEGRSVFLFPIGVLHQPPDDEIIDMFGALCDSSYQGRNARSPAYLVYAGEPVSDALVRRADHRGFSLQSFGEYQRLFDISKYTKRQLERLDGDGRYPTSLYVGQRAKWRILRNDPWTSSSDALDEIASVLDSPHGRLLVVLGDFGTGKTFLMRELCRRLSADGGRAPVLVEMHRLEKHQTLNELLAQHFAAAEQKKIDLDAFRYLLAEGQVVLLFDGFDELAFRVSYDRVLEHFGTVLEAASEQAKVVVTSRTGHFLTDSGINKELADRAQQIGHSRLIKLEPFNEEQIQRFLEKLLPTAEEANARFELLREVKDLLGLSHNPRLLSFIIEIPEDQLRNAKASAGRISSATLYELLIGQWLKSEVDRARETGADPDLNLTQLWHAVSDLALLLWMRPNGGVSIDELPQELFAAAQALEPKRKLDESMVRHQLGSRSLLIRNEEGIFRFMHQSLMEWLVAKAAADEVKETGDASMLGQREMSDLMADFFLALSSYDTAARWAEGKLRTDGKEAAAKNAVRLQRRLREVAPGAAVIAAASGEASIEIEVKLNLEGNDLRGQDFSGQDLRGVNLQRANLSGATLMGADLRRAKLTGANLVRADLTRAQLGGADLTDADLSWARLFDADLREATLTGVRLRGAKLVGAQLRLSDASDTFGAALEVPNKLEPMWWGDSMVTAVAFSPHGDLLVSGHVNGTIHVFDTASMVSLRVLQGHSEEVASVAWSPDGQTLASGSVDNTVRLWKASTGEPLDLLRRQVRARSVAWAPDGQTLASGSFDNTVRLWKASTGEPLGVLQGHTDWVRSVAWSPDGQVLASGSDDKTVRLWRMSTGKPLSVLKGHTRWVISVAWSPDGQVLASGSRDATVRLWKASTGEPLGVLQGHTGGVASVAWGLDGQTLASGSDDATVRLWKASTGEPLGAQQGYASGVKSVAWSPDGQVLASGSADATVRLWKASTGKLLRILQSHTGGVASVAWGPDGRTLASGSFDTTVRLWRVSTGKPLSALKGHTNWVRSVAWSPDGQVLASGSRDATVRLWRASTGEPLNALKGHTKNVTSVSWSADGQTLASGSDDTTMRLWKASTGEPLGMLEGHTGGIDAAAWSPDGQVLASGSDDTTVRLWRMPTGKPLSVLKGHARWVTSVAWSPDGQTLASGSVDTTVRLWKASTGKPLSVLKGHAGKVTSVSWNPYGHTLASASEDGTVRLWDVASSRCLAILLALPEGWVAFTPGGRYKFGGNVAGGFWHAINLCRFEPGELDAYVLGLRLADNTPFVTVAPPPPKRD